MRSGVREYSVGLMLFTVLVAAQGIAWEVEVHCDLCCPNDGIRVGKLCHWVHITQHNPYRASA